MVILYFSGTGNSQFLAEQFAKRMQAAAYSIEQDVDFEGLPAQEDKVEVCYPISGDCFPRILRKFLA